jgi:hypothetical protein
LRSTPRGWIAARHGVESGYGYGLACVERANTYRFDDPIQTTWPVDAVQVIIE